MAEAQCCICSARVNPRFWVCRRCKEEHDLPERFEDWPRWARDLARFEHEARRCYEEEEDYGVVSLDIYDDDVVFEMPHTRPTRHKSSNSMWLDPYDNEADNLTYRRTNKVTR